MRRVGLPPHLVHALSERAEKEGCTQAELMRTAIAAFLAPEGPVSLEAAEERRLDRLTRQLERQEEHLTFLTEAFRQFLRGWLTATPPLADAARAAAEALGRERYKSFIKALAKRLAGGRTLVTEILEYQRAAANDDAIPD